MPLFTKKPVTIEAMRLDAETEGDGILSPNTRAHAKIAGGMFANGFDEFWVSGSSAPFGMDIKTLEGVMHANPGDWIVRGVRGEFYPVKPDIFKATYSPADREAA